MPHSTHNETFLSWEELGNNSLLSCVVWLSMSVQNRSRALLSVLHFILMVAFYILFEQASVSLLPDILSTGKRSLQFWAWQAKFWFPIPAVQIQHSTIAYGRIRSDLRLCNSKRNLAYWTWQRFFFLPLSRLSLGRWHLMRPPCVLHQLASKEPSGRQAAHRELKGGSLINRDLCFIKLPFS